MSAGRGKTCETLNTTPSSLSMELWSGAYFSCLLAHVLGPCMVLHKTTTCSFYSAKELNNVLH